MLLILFKYVVFFFDTEITSCMFVDLVRGCPKNAFACVCMCVRGGIWKSRADIFNT